MRRPLRLAAVAAVLATSLLGGTGAGICQADENDAQNAGALDLFEKSEKAYDSGRFADAIALLKQSYALKKEPVLLYNLGRAYEGLGDLGAAAQSYEAFLQAQPTAPDRGALERRIITLRRQLAEQQALRKQAQEREAPQRRASAVPWVVAGVGAAGLIGGGVIGVLAHQKNDDAKREPTYARADSLHSQAQTFATVSTVCFIAGGVLLAGGVLWGVLDLSAAKSATPAAAGATSFALTF
jgi:tetratricopeptide (TPR) repeat protein